MFRVFSSDVSRKLRLNLICVPVMLAAAFSLRAKPACGWILSLHQPDGAVVQARLSGDEFAHVMTDLQGHALVQNSDGYWCYALYSPDGSSHSSGYVAGTDAPGHILSASTYVPDAAMSLAVSSKRRKIAAVRRDAALKMSSALQAVRAGTTEVKTIILLAQYSDVKMKYTRDDFVSLMTSGDGSAKKYMEDQFLGKCEFTFEIGPLVTLSGKQADYGRNTGEPGTDVAPAAAVAEACRLSSAAGVDFSGFDADNDGVVDNIFLFAAGKDEAEGGGDDCIWSHSWSLSGADIDLTLNGKKIDGYAIASELGLRRNGSYLFTTIGTFCHEFSHTLGLMDMYDTDGDTGGKADCLWGSTCLMDSGNYNDEGRTPPYYNAIDRDMLSLGNPEYLRPGKYSLEPIGENGRYLRYDTGNEGEYYLIECRSRAGWDKYVGGSGLAIYHIDKSDNQAGYSKTYSADVTAWQRWLSNEINCLPSHQCADMIEAYPSASSVKQVFFPYGEHNSFSHLTSPAFTFWDGTASAMAISDIAISGNNVTFTVTEVGERLPDNATVTSKDIFQDAAIIRWETDDALSTAVAIVSWGLSGKAAQELEVEAYAPGKYAVTLEGLAPSTAYSARIYYVSGGVKGKEAVANFTTKSLYKSGYPYIYLNNVSRNAGGLFVRGAELPLRIFNVSDAYSAEWYMDGKRISTDGSGYYKLMRSGRLKAVITYADGSEDIIIKDVRVADE